MEYQIAIYLRLSSADDDISISKEESSSITSQRSYINSFLDSELQFKKADRVEYLDDGYTGTNEKRPAFAKMIQDVRAGKINLIIVKDLSRFFRDYIEAGNYLECVFPFFGVRFISINDGYDSDNFKGTTGSLDIALRNIIYGAYSKDISIKTKSARKLMMKEGKFVGSHAPFGYIMHPTIKNKLDVDVDSAPTVRYIFDLAMKGSNTSCIAKKLNEEKRLTPSEYYKQKFPNDKKFKFTSNKTVWTAAQVYLILTNLRYTGALVSNRKEKVSISENRYQKTNPIVVEGTHTAIVSKKEFDRANSVIKKNKINKVRTPKDYLLKSKVRCGNCRRLMKRKLGAKGNYYFSCAYAYSDKESDCPTGNTLSEEELNALILNAINDTLTLAKTKLKAIESKNDVKRLLQKEMTALEVEKNKIIISKSALYETYASDKLSREDYIASKAGLDAEIRNMEAKLETIQTELLKINTEKNGEQELIKEIVDQYGVIHKLDKSMIQLFLKTVFVYSKEQIEIELNFKDLFTDC